MKITIEPASDSQGYSTVSLSVPEDAVTAVEAARLCSLALIAWGYHPENISEIFNLEG